MKEKGQGHTHLKAVVNKREAQNEQPHHHKSGQLMCCPCYF